MERWERLVREIAEEHGVFVSFANLVGSEGGKVFAGCSSVIGPRGDRLSCEGDHNVRPSLDHPR